MKTIATSIAKIPPKIFNKVAYQNERVAITKYGGHIVVYLISKKDYDLLKKLELSKIKYPFDGDWYNMTIADIYITSKSALIILSKGNNTFADAAAEYLELMNNDMG